MTHTTFIETAPLRTSELRDRFAPIFREIGAKALAREQDRELPFDSVRLLAEAGFGALRVPVEYGGVGATLPQLIELLMDLAQADSNIAQLLRGHFAFVERLLVRPTAQTGAWFGRIADGELVGNAQAERGPETSITTTIERRDGVLRLNGTKYYTTGTLYSDWTWLAVQFDGALASVTVSTRSPGVRVIDDWDGFGQRLTGSGTAVFDDVEVDAAFIERAQDDPGFLAVDARVFFHLVLLAALAGIGRAALEDATAFVRQRTRAYGIPGASSPQNDPAVQIVVGDIASLVYSAEALVRDVARELDAVRDHRADEDALERYAAVQIAQFKAQQITIRNIVGATNQLFEVGGASATSQSRGLDRHWRNARTIASHNPAIFRQRAIGDYLLNGTLPSNSFVAAGSPPASGEKKDA